MKPGLPQGDHANVHMEMLGGLPKRLWWEKYDSPNVRAQEMVVSRAIGVPSNEPF